MLFIQRLLKENKWKYFAFFLVFTILGIVLQLDFQAKTDGQYALSVRSLYVLLWYGKEPIQNYLSSEMVEIPGLWFWVHGVVYLFLLRCFDRNAEYSYVWIVKHGSRSRIWNQVLYRLLLNGVIYTGLLWLALRLAAAFGKGALEIPPVEELDGLAGIYRNLSIVPSERMPMFWIHVILMPLLVCITINILQETIAVFAGVPVSIMVSFGYFFVTVFAYHWGIIGNATMLARTELAGYASDWWKSGLLCLGISTVCYLAGRRRIIKEDIMEGM